jgi:hypothetical protein
MALHEAELWAFRAIASYSPGRLGEIEKQDEDAILCDSFYGACNVGATFNVHACRGG